MDKQNNKTEYAVDLFELRKSFKKSALKSAGYSSIKSLLLHGLKPNGSENGNSSFNAIEDLTIRIPKGDSVGIIGRNGSGKSTLLKLITGIYQPNHGHVKVNGRVAALIELGAGFHPDFTGRENLYLGGVLHGLSKKEINEKFDEIVEFAELEDYIDQPVRTYSSGMFMRLGFSLAVNTDPDILLIDEVLAVGDASFITKCQNKISELKRKGKTLFMVSHDLGAIERWSDEVIWLDKGVVKDRGQPRRVIDHYREFIEKGEEEGLEDRAESIQAEVIENEEEQAPVDEMQYQRWGSREIEIQKVEILNTHGEKHLLFHTGEPAVISISYQVKDKCRDLVFGFGITRSDGTAVIGTNTDLEEVNVPELDQTGYVKIIIPGLNLLDGTYYLDVAAHREDGYPYDYHKNVLKFSVHSEREMIGVLDTRHSWQFD